LGVSGYFPTKRKGVKVKIGNLGMHCGECGVIDFCGAGYGYAICSDNRFKYVDVDEYERIADKTPSAPVFDTDDGADCVSCNRSGLLDDGNDCDNCDVADMRKDAFARHIADYVYSQLPVQKCEWCGKMHKEGTLVDCKFRCASCLGYFASSHCEVCRETIVFGTALCLVCVTRSLRSDYPKDIRLI